MAMAEAMGPGGWHVQVDADEYILDFKGFCDYLKALDPHPSGKDKAINVCLNLIPLIKKTATGYIAAGAVDGNYEVAPFATNVPVYEAARRNGHFNHVSPFFALHETWARDEQTLWGKINNWGHRDDFNKESYFAMWKAIDEYNFKYISNFHPIEAKVWPFLFLLPGKDQVELVETARRQLPLQVSTVRLFFKNSRLVQRTIQKLKLS
jgi:hypothetical protein